MTQPPSIKTATIDKFSGLDLHQLETVIRKIQQGQPTPESKDAARAARQALRGRQRYIKAHTMEFEQINDHYLLIFDSTDNFSKIAGRSVLFYALTIAERIHRRFSIKNDTDDYSRSDDGIISIRSLPQLEIQLAEINIYPDRNLSTTELHFYKLPRTYSEEQIAKFRDHLQKDAERIISIILPKSPVPELYDNILELNRLLYHNCKRISDSLARSTLVPQILLAANEILTSYLNFANAKPSSGIVCGHFQDLSNNLNQPQLDTEISSPQTQNLFYILLTTRNLRNNLANFKNLHLIHHRELCAILDKIVNIERLAAREYSRGRETDRKKFSSPPVNA